MVFNLRLPAAVQTAFQEAFDATITTWGAPCRLYLPPTQVPCSNCKFDNIGRKSSNRYLHGGPAPFPLNSICPLCNGNGFRATENTQTITMICSFNPKSWFADDTQGMGSPLLLRIPDGYVGTKGFIWDLPKVKQCVKAMLATNLEPYNRYLYTLDSEPVDRNNLFQARYFHALWKRV